MRQLAAEPVGPWASAGSLVGRVRVQEIPKLISTHQWVKPGPGPSAGPLAVRAGSWGLAAGRRCPRACIGPLVGGVRSHHSWLWVPGCPEACVGLLVGMARAQPDPGLVPACWWVSYIHRLGGCSFPGADVHSLVCEAGPKARVDLLVTRARNSGLNSCNCSVELGSSVSGCRALGRSGSSAHALMYGAWSWVSCRQGSL